MDKYAFDTLSSCSLLSGAIHFWKTGEIRYVCGILLQLLGKSAVWLDEMIPYCFALHCLFELKICFCSIVSCPVSYGLIQSTPEAFIPPVILALRMIIGIALYYLIPTLCRFCILPSPWPPPVEPCLLVKEVGMSVGLLGTCGALVESLLSY